MTAGYVHNTYNHYLDGSRLSAMAVAEVICRMLHPTSVVDIGCGTGVWLQAFREEGVEHLHGIDGPWAPATRLLAPHEFSQIDFEQDPLSSPEGMNDGRYDLVISLEFLEHVSPHRAEALVDFLCARGDMLLVSAAIPLQGGQHHVNEQWPEYWVEKFRRRGFVPFDVLRLALWDDQRIEPWYRQNMMLFFRGEVPADIRQWGSELAMVALDRPVARVHPEFYARRLGRILYALQSPLRFFQMLWSERKSGKRGAPPIGGLARDYDMTSAQS